MPEDVSAIFRARPKNPPPNPIGVGAVPAPIPIPPAAPGAAPGSVLPAAMPSVQQLGGMLNGLVGNVFENNNWWLWAAVLIIFFNPDLRKKLFSKGKEAD